MVTTSFSVVLFFEKQHKLASDPLRLALNSRSSYSISEMMGLQVWGTLLSLPPLFGKKKNLTGI